MVRGRRPPSQSCKTFLRNHAEAIAAVDVCVVPTVTFERLFAFLVLGHGRRQLLWFEVTRHPSAEWLARQITEAFPWASAPTYLVRDNDDAYGHAFSRRVMVMGIRDRPISPRSPWQNGHVERLTGTVRRECLDRMLIFGEAHPRQILTSYASYYPIIMYLAHTYPCTRMRRWVERSNDTETLPLRPFRRAASSLRANVISGKDNRALPAIDGARLTDRPAIIAIIICPSRVKRPLRFACLQIGMASYNHLILIKGPPGFFA